MDIKNVIARTKANEGFKDKIYTCSEGYLTIGYGWNLEKTPMPIEVAELMLKHILKGVIRELLGYKWFLDMDDKKKEVVVDMAYQMGVAGVLKFKRMIAAVEGGDYQKAADELMDSVYAKQTHNRAIQNEAIMRS